MCFLVAFCPWICLDGHFQLEGGEDGCGLAWQFFQDKFPGSDAREVMTTYPNAPRALETHCSQCFLFRKQ